MSSQQSTVDYILEQSPVRHRHRPEDVRRVGMYCDGKIMALICDDQLYIKPTKAGRTISVRSKRAPYPRQAVLPDRRRTLGRCRMAGRIRVTCGAAVNPKPKK